MKLQYEDMWKRMYPKCVPEKSTATMVVDEPINCTILDKFLTKKSAFYLVQFEEQSMMFKVSGVDGQIMLVGEKDSGLKSLQSHFAKGKEKANAK